MLARRRTTLDSVGDRWSARNEVNGTVAGSVVQAGVIHQVVLPGHEAVPVPRQLPGPVPDFVGRDAAVVALDSLLATTSTSAVHVVEGMAGVGKTTLAVWWAHKVQENFRDGTLFVNLRGYDREQPLHPSSVLVSFLQGLGVPGARIPTDLDAQVGLYRSSLVGRRVLVVLDNASSAEQVRPLLPGATGCLTLVTSRRALMGLAVSDGARSLSLRLFSRGDAERLLRGVIGDHRVDREPEAVARLVDLCARLPLALRVAASRVAARGRSRIADLVEEIDGDRLDSLSDTGDERSAVRAVFDWSFTRLHPDPALLFRRLGLHPTPEFGSHAAAAFGGTGPQAARRYVEALVDANLVEPIDHRRYRLHDLLHLYAARRCEADEPPEIRLAALRAGLSWYAHTALVADALVFPAHPRLAVDLGEPPVEAPVRDRDQAWAWFTAEFDTLLAALRQALAHDMHRIAVALAGSFRFLVFRPRALWPVRLEAESLGLHAARVLGDVETETTFLRRRADTYQMLGRWADSDADLSENVVLAERTGDGLQLGRALCGLGRSRKLQGQLEEAREVYLRALDLVRGSGHVEAVVEANLSQISAGLGRYVEALDHARRELELRRGGADPAAEGYALHDVAAAYQGLGDDGAAVEFGERAIDVYRTTAATEGYLATALETVALSYERRGSDAAARRCLVEAAAILTELGDPRADLVRRRVSSDLAS
ncbi:ATP-binding protein [Actinosynnema sp. NPDC059335]|uniref:ATP-binding protein n=1 Tax=Actinosynnema sp. NPDC059335 TaxID=3346804 RepID=UPI00366B9DF8